MYIYILCYITTCKKLVNAAISYHTWPNILMACNKEVHYFMITSYVS